MVFDGNYGLDQPIIPAGIASNSIASAIQTAIYQGFAATGAVLGQPFALYRYGYARPAPLRLLDPAAGFDQPILGSASSQQEAASSQSVFDGNATLSEPILPNTSNSIQGPVQPSCLVDTLPAVFANKGNFTRPGNVKDPEEIGYFDASQTQPGDYLVGPSATYFISTQDPLLPVLCILCNHVFSLSRAPSQTTSGEGAYGGSTGATEKPLFTAWPGSCLQGTKGERGDVTLPDDIRTPWWAIRLPAIPGILMKTDDFLTDENDIRYSISSAELTNFGWRVTARQNTS